MTFTDVIANPPASLAEWDRIIRRDHYLHLRSPEAIKKMYQNHKAKAVHIEVEYQSRVDHPGYYRKIFMANGMTSDEANAQIVVDIDMLDTKRKRLHSLVKCCSVEYLRVEGEIIE